MELNFENLGMSLLLAFCWIIYLCIAFAIFSVIVGWIFVSWLTWFCCWAMFLAYTYLIVDTVEFLYN